MSGAGSFWSQAEWAEWSNTLADLVPEEYHDDVAQEAIVERALADLVRRVTAAESAHRDLVSRLGFGDDITEPMADNDTVVAWFEQQSRDANEWQESQLWRSDCYVAGHPDDEDCWEHDPTLRLEAAESALAAVRADAFSEDAQAVLFGVTGTHPETYGGVTKDEALECAGEVLTRIRAALATPTTTERNGS